MAKKGTKAETIVRAQKFARIIANGGRRSDCVRYAAENWGGSYRMVLDSGGVVHADKIRGVDTKIGVDGRGSELV